MQGYTRIWVLLDEAAGHMNQVLGVAEALQMPFEIKFMNYNKISALPNMLLGATLKTLTAGDATHICAPWPDVVIAAGRKTLPIARYIKKCNQGKTNIVYLMDAGFPRWDIDLMAVPEHDNTDLSDRMMRTVGAPNRVQPDFLAQESGIWEKTLEEYPAPRIAVLLGGNTDKISFSAEDGSRLAERLEQLTGGEGSLLISSSRRTPQPFFDAFIEKLAQAHFVHDPEKNKKMNPYYAFLALADQLVVTADSVSMLSEACTTGKPVFAFRPKSFNSQKHQDFLHRLLRDSCAIDLERVPKATPTTHRRLDSSNQVAAKIREMFL